MAGDGPVLSAPQGMVRHLVAAALLGLAFTGLLFWPLPLYPGSGIVENTQPAGEEVRVGPVSPGDPLQLMHHFWMFTDMVSGNTPWFHNVYEFNTGDDSARFEPSTYYLPFSLFFAIGYWIHGYAFGWNLASLISIMTTAWLTFLLARRFAGSACAAWCCTAFALALPYRWLTLGGGSPTGFTMAWIPLLLLGIDRMARDRSIAGAALAGLAILLTSLADAHCFFFSIIAAPAWFLLAWIHRLLVSGPPPSRVEARPMMIGGAAIALFTAIAYGLQKTMTTSIGESGNADGRSLREVSLFTPDPAGLFSRTIHGVSEHVYLGFALPALAALALLAGLVVLRRGMNRRTTLALLTVTVLMACGIALCVALALGMKGPFEGQLFLWARDLVPPYRMIRQPSKIYCLLPSLIAVLSAWCYRMVRLPGGRAWIALWMLVIAGGLADTYLRVTPRIGILPREQRAYAAVASDAAGNGIDPRAVIITLWPGESHFSSIYQHWASNYRIRMVNGYSPFVPKEYVDDVFHRLSSMNMGILDDHQAEWLLARDIRYVLIHENIYPAKVSPYPVGFALARLLEHPRLALLEQDGPVYAFRLLDRPRPSVETAFPGDRHFWPGARAAEAEQLREARDHVTEDPSASRGRMVAMREPEQGLIWPGWDIVPGANIHWAFRVRGDGRLLADRYVMKEDVGTVELAVASTNWTWVHVAMPHPETHRYAHVEFRLAEGSVDVDMALLMGGDPVALAPGESWILTAAHLFRTGYSSPELEHVVFDPAIESGTPSLSGPHVPFPPGRYELAVDFETPAPAGTTVGTWDVQAWRGETIATAPMIAGQPFTLEVAIRENLPLETILKLNPFTHAVTVRALALKRMD